MAEKIQGVSGIGVAAIFAGGLLAYAAAKGFSVAQVTQSVIAGKNPEKLQPVNTVTPGGLFSGLFSGIPIIGSLLGGGSGGGNVKSTGGSVAPGTNAQNKSLGQKMAAAVGWTGAQWTALNNIVMSESGWSSTVVNPTSPAAGIAQNINGFGPGYQRGNAAQQIAWLISYIKTRYGNPVNAWNFHLAHGWY